MAQIQVLRAGETAWDTDLSIYYTISKEGEIYKDWDGEKAKPAKGEYIITQSTDSILVQVTPANYDLSALDLKIVTANNEEVPVELGKAVPYKGKLTANSRAASTTGMYLIPVELKNITDENVDEYQTEQYVSIIANDKVRSAFDGSLDFKLQDAENLSVNINFGQYFYQNDIRYFTVYPDVKPGATFTADIMGKEYLYDAYITMYDGSELPEDQFELDVNQARITQAKADQVRYGIKCDGLTITCNDNAIGEVWFSVHYIDVRGMVKSQKLVITYAEEQAPIETVNTIESAAHTATGEAANQYFVADLTPYFEAMTDEERLIWNDEFDQYYLIYPSSRFGFYNIFEDEDGNRYYGIKWEYVDSQTGRTITEYIDSDLLQSIVALKADGTEATKGSEVAKLKIAFAPNYTWSGDRLSIDSDHNAKGQYTAIISVDNWIKQEDGSYSKSTPAAYLEIPFTIAEPTAAELQKQYTYNSFYYNATDGVFTVVDINDVNISELIQGTTLNPTELETAADYNGEVNVYTDGTIRWNATDNDGEEVAKGKVYSFTGVTFQYLNGTFDIPTFKVKFVNSQPYSLNMASANITLQSGDVTSTDNIVYAEKATKDEPVFYNVKDVFSKFVAATNIASVEIVDFVSPKGQTGADLLEYPTVSGQTITVQATAEKASQNSTATVKVKVTMNDGETVDGQFTVTIKAYPHN